jgi:hypothetical protein
MQCRQRRSHPTGRSFAVIQIDGSTIVPIFYRLPAVRTGIPVRRKRAQLGAKGRNSAQIGANGAIRAKGRNSAQFGAKGRNSAQSGASLNETTHGPWLRSTLST